MSSKSWLRVVIALVVIGAGVVVYLERNHTTEGPSVTIVNASVGDVVETAIATGTLNATRTVQVGSQVSGTVRKLYADYNSLVRRDQVMAEIDPAPLEAQLDSAKAALDRADIDLDEARATLALDARNRDRAEELFVQHVATEVERETAELQVKTDEATVQVDEAAITVAKAGVDEAQLNLGHTVIRSPIDGVVISRNVDEGQTVQASAAAPTLYVLATDLTSLQLLGDVDESDVGRIRPGQAVTFTVDAFPGQQFGGTMTEVRLNSTSVNNVVTYQTVSSVTNPDLRLVPGMTANFKVEISRTTNVRRVPMTAIRFRPTRDIFAAFGQTPVSTAPALEAASPAVATAPTPAAFKSASTIDALFAPVPRPDTAGQVWILADGQLQRIPLRLGVSDGTFTEVLSGDLPDDANVVVSVLLPKASTGR